MSEWQMFGLIAICMVHCMWLVDQEKKRFNREIEKAHERISKLEDDLRAKYYRLDAQVEKIPTMLQYAVKQAMASETL